MLCSSAEEQQATDSNADVQNGSSWLPLVAVAAPIFPGEKPLLLATQPASLVLVQVCAARGLNFVAVPRNVDSNLLNVGTMLQLDRVEQRDNGSIEVRAIASCVLR